MYQVYVIQNSDGRFYIGMSEDVNTHLRQHSDGVPKWTRAKGPRILRWSSEAMSITDAGKVENYLKKQKGGYGFYRKTGV